MLNRTRVALAVVSVAGLAACVNPYQRFYSGMPDARQAPRYEATTGEPQVFSSGDVQADVHAALRKGYMVVGYSSFNARSDVNAEYARWHARQIGAHVVLVASKYSHTVSGAIPWSVPKTTTSYSTGTATAYGPGGTVTAYGSGTTTTYGSETVMIPYSVARSDYVAVFLAKHRPLPFGAFMRDLDENTRRAAQTNAGVQVIEIEDGSPAANADILPGDVLLYFNTERITNMARASELIKANAGQTVVVRLNRNGTVIDKELRFREE
jgi:membrane-associated protease RseP (regulator of RpoE activity)